MSAPAYVPQAPVAPKTSVLAILGLVFAFVFWPAGIVLSVLGLRETKQGRGGRGFAMAGLVLSVVFGVLTILSVVLSIAMIGATSV